MNARPAIPALCYLLFCGLIATTQSQAATGEVLVTAPVVDDIITAPADQGSMAVSGTYILTEDATPNFTGAAASCESGIGTFQPDYWEGGEPSGAPVGYYAELFFRVDGGPRHKTGAVRYGHAYRPGTGYSQLNTLLPYSFSVSLTNLQENEAHEILIELIDVYSLRCKPLYWWYLTYEQKLYGEVITSFSIPFFIGEQSSGQDNQTPDPDPGGCHSNDNQVAID